MKRQLHIAIMLFLSLGFAAQAWGQASTVGKEFWVSSTIVCSPGGSSNKATPYIAISAEKACTVQIQGGLNNAINITQQVAAGSWSQFGDASVFVDPNNPNRSTVNTNPANGPINVAMNTADWYPVAASDASNVRSLAGQINHYGLHITATEEISVYVILSSLNSMDASNILPLTAIQSEYYTQDYSPVVKSGFSNTISMVTILATENNTQVDIIPNGATYDGHANGVPYSITLQEGQTYYMMSAADQQIGGSHIQARNGKKIAVFCGIPLTNIPSNIAARDGLFEQVMPVDYWGNQFVVTRSLWKNGNLIGITALEDGTEVKIDGNSVTFINAGETYYVMLQSPKNLPHAKNPGTGPVDLVIAGDAAYIETSCPCAIFSYDTGNSYAGSSDNEIQNSKGDPSSVWVSPLQQKINDITFGTCYTKKTKDHFLNIIAETATCQQTTLTAINGTTRIDKTSTLIWIPVPGNPAYSYARVQIGTSANETTYKVFKLHNPRGFIANIYGNGEDESYAYSAGSAAVKRGISVEGKTYTDGLLDTVTSYCVNVSVAFDAQVGTDVIDKVDWDFGDGVTEHNSTPQFSHTYTSPGWYDVIARVYAHKECPETTYPAEDVQFSFYVQKPQEIRRQAHACVGDVIGGEELTEPGDSIYTIAYDCDSIVTYYLHVGMPKDTSETFTFKNEGWAYGQYFDADTTFTRELKTWDLCDSLVYVSVHVSHCFKMQLTGATYDCDVDRIAIAYTLDRKGGHITQVEDLVMDIDGREQEVTLSPDGYIYFTDIDSLAPNYYLAKLSLYDTICKDSLYYSIPVQVNYSNTIFDQVYSNVLAVRTAAFNGGYYFTGYQWCQNGMPILGANESVYHTMEPITQAEYTVVLSRNDGTVISSCPKSIYLGIIPEATAPARQVEKKLEGNRLLIVTEDGTYDSYGNRVE